MTRSTAVALAREPGRHLDRTPRESRRGRLAVLGALPALVAAMLSGCSLGGGASTPAIPASSTNTGTHSGTGAATAAAKPCPAGGTVLVATHDSFVVPDPLLATFTAQTGCTAKILKSGDAGKLTNQLVLTKSSPIADAVFGIDNTFASRAVNEGILADYTPVTLPPGAGALSADGTGAAVLTPVDYGDVCVNFDTQWFAARQLAAPKTLADLTKASYKDLFVTPAPTTSSPGMAFFLATVGAFGTDGWTDYWTKLKANGVKITSGWSDAYEVDFTQGGGKGTRPIVLSYNTSPPFTIPKGKTEPTTAALLDTCFRQVEYAGVLAGAKNPAGAKAFVDFLVSDAVQGSIAENMYMYPASDVAPIPKTWGKWALPATKTFQVSSDDINANRDAWLKAWTELIGQ